MVYDNHSFVVESFLDEPVEFQIITGPEYTMIRDLSSGEELTGSFREAPAFRNRKFGKDVNVFSVQLKPHSFKAYGYD